MKRPEDELKKMSENIEIPESLKPENMMKKLQSKVHRDTLQDEEMKKEAWCKKKNVKKIFSVGVAIAAAAAIAMTGIFYGKDFFGKSKQAVFDNSSSSIENYSLKHYTNRSEVIDKIYQVSKVDHTAGSADKESNSVMTDEMNAESAQDAARGSGIDEYYHNNDQEEGVQEADYVLTDGKAIYSLGSDNKIHIAILNGTELSQTVQLNLHSELEKLEDVQGKETNIYNEKFYLGEDKLMVTFSSYNYGDEWYSYDSDEVPVLEDVAYLVNNNSTYIFVYDISNPATPKLQDWHKVDGDMVSSRVHDGYLYLITNRMLYEHMANPSKEVIEKTCIPKIDDKEIDLERIYLDELDTQTRYEIVSSFEIQDDGIKLTDVIATACVYSEQTYVSEKNIYAIAGYYDTDAYKSEIHKISYEKGTLKLEASAIVDGIIRNQFSLDEYQGYLRVVYTKYGEEDVNALSIMNENMEEVSRIDNIAVGEEIKSARFYENIVYFVTFENTDPLFVADLTDVSAPRIVGELNMPGFSEYLHKWDENTLLGVGNDAEEDGTVKGLKLSLYDVSSLTEPFVKFDYTAEHVYRDSIDYKDMMIAPEKSLIGMTVTAYDMNYEEQDGEVYQYMEPLNTTYTVYKIDGTTVEDVFEYEYQDEDAEKGEDNYDDYVYWDGNFYRGVYVGEYLYIVTIDKGVAVVDMNDYSVVSEIDFN